MNIRGTIDTITGMVGSVTDFGLKLIVALVVVFSRRETRFYWRVR